LAKAHLPRLSTVSCSAAESRPRTVTGFMVGAQLPERGDGHGALSHVRQLGVHAGTTLTPNGVGPAVASELRGTVMVIVAVPSSPG
jgi:hypothetical protein